MADLDQRKLELRRKQLLLKQQALTAPAAQPQVSAIVPPQPFEAGTGELMTRGPGPTGYIDPALYEMGAIGRRMQPGTPQPTGGAGNLGDVEASFLSGVARGTANLADTPGQLFNAGGGLLARGLNAVGVPKTVTDEAVRSLGFGPMGTGSTAREGTALATAGGSEYKPQTRPGRYAASVGEFLPGAALTGGNARNLLTYGILPGLAAEAAGEATQGKRFPDTWPMVGGASVEPVARAGAAIFSPIAATTAENVVRAAITPNPADPRFTEAARKLADEGVNITAGQAVGSPNLRYLEDTRPVTQNIMTEQADQFTAAALRRIGVDAKGATPDVMAKAGDELGNQFSTLASRNTILPDQELANAADAVLTTYQANTSRLNVVPAIKDAVKKIVEAVGSGKPISGEQYQKWRSELGKLSVKGDSNTVKEAARGIVNALDAAMERTLTFQNRTDELAMYADVRGKWRDYLAIADAVDGAGVNAALGVVTPGNLGSAVRAQDDMAYVTGRRDLGELARAGTISMSPLPNSGTQPRLMAQGLTGFGSGGALGALAYGMTNNPQIAALATGVGAMLPTFRNAAVSTRPIQAYLRNQLVTGRVPTVGRGILPVIGQAGAN